MPGTKSTETPADFAGRLALAISLSGTTRTAVERRAGLGRGRIQRLLGLGSKPILSPGPDVIRALADELAVRYEWLAIGRGPMRDPERELTPFEQATKLVQWANVRADAIAIAAERHGSDPEMDAIDFVRAIDDIARRLERSGTPRPEVVAAQQRLTRRTAAKIERQKAEIATMSAHRLRPPKKEAKP